MQSKKLPWEVNIYRTCLISAIMGCSFFSGPAMSSDSLPTFRSHRPQRRLPSPRNVPLAVGPKRFVDCVRGDDTDVGTETAPWKTLFFATRQLQPGDTLYLRGGDYYERVSLSKSGRLEQPITIAGYPGESVVIDGGLREFADEPSLCWEPYAAGGADEFVSTKTFFDTDNRRVPTHFLPGSWEPMWGIEEQRPLALGHFADSMVPLHGYRTAIDLRAANELWLGGKNESRDVGNYAGPGIWFNRETGRIHIRLAHNQLPGLDDRAYRGETDPRKVALVVALGFGDEVFRVTGVQHVALRDLTFRGATGSPLLSVYGSQNIHLDHLTVYGGFPALLINASQNIHVTHSVFRGLAAPWTSRAHMKYRGTATYQIVLQNNQPMNENIEFGWCEFTDDHDCAFLRYVKNLQFHHNFVDNFNDDGLECGPKLRDHTLFIYQNRIGRILIPLTQHEIFKDESPVEHDPLSGVFVFRNVFDLRGGTYKVPPTEVDPSGAFLHGEGSLIGDHGGPIWPVIRFYHNTAVRQTPVFRDYFLFGLGAQGLRQNERDVFNNIFVQIDRVPGAGFAGIKQIDNLRAGGNFLWGVKDGALSKGEAFQKFRASPMFEASRRSYPAGLTTHDRVSDPQFVQLSAESQSVSDLRLSDESPAVDSGLPLPAEWPDPLHESDSGKPDVGAVPLHSTIWGVGVDGRIPLFGEN